VAFYDIFNGDADGLCALHQLRLAEPRAGELVTGVKREIDLLGRIEAASGDRITVLDVSFDVNREAALGALSAGADVEWFDHHFAGEVPSHPRLAARIDTAPDLCTSLIVDRHLGGAHRAWAAVAAFGDNLAEPARAAAAACGFAPHAIEQLRELGECLNYNAYGDSVEDLYYPPADLYRTLAPYADPFRFISDEPVLEVLRGGLADDLYRSSELAPAARADRWAIYVMPDAAWSRRVSGSFSNRLAREHPARAHAVLTVRSDGYTVSVRAPVSDPRGADALCRAFPGGGGRAGAGGINRLPQADLERFARAFAAAYG